MSTYRQLKTLIGVLSVATSLTILPSHHVQAGFTWTAPTASQVSQAGARQAPPQMVMPSIPAAPVVQAPVPAAPTVAPSYSAPRAMPIPQSAPQMATPNIVLEPMGQASAAPAPITAAPVPQAAISTLPSFAPSAPVQNPNAAPVTAPDIVFNDTPMMMPEASVAPQQSASTEKAEPLPLPRPRAMAVPQTMSVENGMNPSQPRRIRPDLGPQSLVPNMAMGAPMGSPIGAGQAGMSGRVDFVPAPMPGVGPSSIGDIVSAGQSADPSVGAVQMRPIVDTPHMQSAATPVYPSNVLPAPMIASAPNVPFSSSGMPRGVYEDAVGFGKDLPLMIAVKQIVPNDYGISIVPGVGDGLNVSWQGGRPWNEALDLALAPQGLQSVVNGNVVTIMPMSADVPSAPMPAGMVPQYQIISDGLPSGQVFNASPVYYNSQPIAEPSSLLQNAAMSSTASSVDLFTPVAASAGQPIPQTMTGSMGGFEENLGGAGVAAPVQSMRPQIYDSGVQFWAAPKDSSLREVLTSWTRKAGVELFWSSQYDYPISTAVNVEGNFEEAVQILLRGLEESNPRPLGRLHPNLPNGPAVLVIESRGVSD